MCTNAYLHKHTCTTESTFSFMDIFLNKKKEKQCMCSICYCIISVMKILNTKHVIWNQALRIAVGPMCSSPVALNTCFSSLHTSVWHWGEAVWKLAVFISNSCSKECNESGSLISFVVCSCVPYQTFNTYLCSAHLI